jgi:hypothetical protein
VHGDKVLVTTGKYDFRTYDVDNPRKPVAPDTFQPPEILGTNGYWQDEDMELDTRSKRTPTASPGSAGAAASSAMRPRAAGATRT